MPRPPQRWSWWWPSLSSTARSCGCGSSRGNCWSSSPGSSSWSRRSAGTALAEVMTALIGTDSDGSGAYRAAVAGAGLSNVLNNLPAYTAGEAVIPEGNSDQLLPCSSAPTWDRSSPPWASLATLLCLESCRDHGLRVPLRKFVLTGLGLAVVALTVSVGALLRTR